MEDRKMRRFLNTKNLLIAIGVLIVIAIILAIIL